MSMIANNRDVGHGGRVCAVCGQSNETYARYCAACGRDLPALKSGAPGISVGFALLGGGVAAGFMFLLFGVGTLALTHHNRAAIVKVEAKRSYRLQNAKASALVDLLAPRDVAVFVERRGQLVTVQGTRQQIRVMDRLIELLIRHEKYCQTEHPACFNAHTRTWTSRVDYRLGRRNAQRLFELLAFNDVPVLVSSRGSHLVVQATPSDQQTIRDVAKMIRS